MAQILFVDDEPYYMRSLTDSLEDEGYHVTLADSVESTIDNLRRSTPDLIILDIIMPQGELQGTDNGLRTGVKLHEIIRDEMRIRSPIIFVTVVDSSAVIAQIERIERRHGQPSPIILQKVVLPSELLHEVRQILAKK